LFIGRTRCFLEPPALFPGEAEQKDAGPLRGSD
jgi:hypothetical protein